MSQDHSLIPIKEPGDVVPPNAPFGSLAATHVEVTPARRVAAEVEPRAASAEFRDYARVVHRSLRGRYAIAIVLALLGACTGAAVTWRFVRPTYHSEALLRIAYTLPAVVQETDQNGPMAMFDTFMLSQRLLINSRSVIDQAIQDPIWRATGRKVPNEPDRYYAEHMDVEIRPRSEFILITVHDEDPGTAAAAVTAVVNAYTDWYNRQDKTMQHQRTGALDDRLTFLQGNITDLTNKLQQKSKDYGPNFYDAAAARVIKLDQAISDVDLALATAASRPTDVVASPATQHATNAPDGGDALGARHASDAVGASDILTPEQIATTDPEMRRRLDEQSRLQGELDRMSASGLLPGHKNVVTAHLALEKAQKDVQDYLEIYRSYLGRSINDRNPGRALTLAKSPTELATDKDRLGELRKQTMAEMVDWGNKRLEIEGLEAELNSVREESSTLSKRAGVLRAEGSLGGRLNVINSGEIPLSPDRNSRILFACAGAAAGGILPIIGLVALGLLRRRYEFWDEPEADIATTVPLLGIVPDLEDEHDELQMAAAARSIHQMRVSLRAQQAVSSGLAASKSCVYLITSATAGEGKSSLTMSLGLSFAVTGLRTLIIDCDLVGRNLTKAFRASQLTGLREALDQGALRGVIRRTHAGLYVLAAGGMSSADANSLSAGRLASVLEDARKYFHIILIDSGPILGSLEASVVCSHVDGAILTVSRGQDRILVRNALRRLRSLRVPTTGFVYNRAKAQDFQSSPYASSSSSLNSKVETATHNGAARDLASSDNDPLDAFGPLVRAVGAGIPIVSTN